MPYVGPGPRGHEETAPGRRSAVVMRPVMLRWQRRQEAHRLALADAEALSAIMAPRPTARPASTTRTARRDNAPDPVPGALAARARCGA